MGRSRLALVCLVSALPAFMDSATHCAAAPAEIADASFEEASPRWQALGGPNGTHGIRLSLDYEVSHGGGVSARVVNESGSDWSFPHWAQAVETFPKRTWVELSVWVRLEAVRYTAQLAVQCWDGEAQRSAAWESSADRQKILGAADWQRHSLALFVPAQTTVLWIRLGLVGPGKVWFDEVTLTELPTAPPPLLSQAAPGQNLLLNGGFEQQHPGPFTHWIPYRYDDPDNKVEFTRDTMIHRTGAAARIMNRNWMNRHPNHWGQLVTPAPVGRKVTLSGWIKTQSVEGEAGLLIQCFDGPLGKHPKLLAERGSQELTNVQGNTDWTRVSVALVVPADSAQVWVRAFLKGPGTAWFDDLELTVDE